MRIDKNLAVFLGHHDWYTFIDGKGYIPNNNAPRDAIEAMEKFNRYTYSETANSKHKIKS